MYRSLSIMGLVILTSFSIRAQECPDLSELDFGLCEMPLGVINLDGECTFISGCGWEIGGVDYSPYFFEDELECQQCVDGCIDVGGVDFGDCEAMLGIALDNGNCNYISGCSWDFSGVDYSPYSFETIEDCQAACMATECVDLLGVDFGPCEAILGISLLDGSCSYISGCSWAYSGVDYSPYSFNSLADCQLACEDLEECLDLADIDFGDCDFPLGIANIDGSCISISGCDWTVGGVDYSPYFFESLDDCEFYCDCYDGSLVGTLDCTNEFDPVCGCDNKTYWNACLAMNDVGISAWTEGPCSCPDPILADPDVACFTLWEPVCGCDDVTYSNSCVAFYQNGITEWVEGECGQSVGEQNDLNVSIWPNPNNGFLNILIEESTMVRLELFDLSGRMIETNLLSPGLHNWDLEDLASGSYVIVLNGMSARRIMIH